MKLKSKLKKKSAQEIQNEIFQKMNPDKKILVGSQLWRLAKTLVGKKIDYGINRPPKTSSRNRKNS